MTEYKKEHQGHAILSVYKETAAQRFPLILVIGREPNAGVPVMNFVGPYDFSEHPRCAFWNTSYAMIAEVVGMQTWQLKHSCVTRRSSPVVYADVLSQSIPNVVKDKDELRTSIPNHQIEQHVQDMFGHQEILRRVAVAVFSGVDREVFKRPVDAMVVQLEQANIPYIHLPFFHGMHSKRIRIALTDASRLVIKKIVEQFLTQTA